jgi:hypothetical protein
VQQKRYNKLDKNVPFWQFLSIQAGKKRVLRQQLPRQSGKTLRKGRLSPMRLFDVLGPVMIGPSSSHTAGAAKIGYTAQKLLGEVPAQADIGLYGSFATTGKGHGTDRALVAGLLGLRPVWYYRNGYLPYGMKASIAGMAGPVIWLVGLAALVGLLWHQVSGRGSRQGAGVLILYGTQLIPWMLVTRCTFLYHYFPSSMFCLAALALVLARMKHVDWAKKIAACLCVVALVLFVLYYPALSGLPIPAWWADALNALPSFGFY